MVISEEVSIAREALREKHKLNLYTNKEKRAAIKYRKEHPIVEVVEEVEEIPIVVQKKIIKIPIATRKKEA